MVESDTEMKALDLVTQPLFIQQVPPLYVVLDRTLTTFIIYYNQYLKQ